MVDKFATVPALGLTRVDRALGALRARLNRYVRVVVYRFVL